MTAAPRPLRDRNLVVLLAAISAMGPVSLNIYLPALPAMEQAFRASVPQIQLTLSVAVLAFAVGLLFWGPLSDRFGRRPMLLTGIAIFNLGTLLCLIASNLELLIFGRAIQALGSAAGIIVSRAMVGDLFQRESMARMLALLTMTMVLGPTVAPLIGSALLTAAGWRSVFAFLLAAGLLVGIVAWRVLPETRSAQERDVDVRSLGEVARNLLARPAFANLSLQGAAMFAIFMVFISTVPHVMVGALRRPPAEFSLYFMMISIAYMLGNALVARYAARRGLPWLINTGVMLTALGAVAALALVMLGLRHPTAIFLPIALLALGEGMALPTVMASAVGLAPKHSGIASSLLSFFQQLASAISVQLIGSFSTETALPMLVFCAGVACFGLLALRVFNPARLT